jgi:hypothetical protein
VQSCFYLKTRSRLSTSFIDMLPKITLRWVVICGIGCLIKIVIIVNIHNVEELSKLLKVSISLDKQWGSGKG